MCDVRKKGSHILTMRRIAAPRFLPSGFVREIIIVL